MTSGHVNININDFKLNKQEVHSSKGHNIAFITRSRVVVDYKSQNCNWHEVMCNAYVGDRSVVQRFCSPRMKFLIRHDTDFNPNPNPYTIFSLFSPLSTPNHEPNPNPNPNLLLNPNPNLTPTLT